MKSSIIASLGNIPTYLLILTCSHAIAKALSNFNLINDDHTVKCKHLCKCICHSSKMSKHNVRENLIVKRHFYFFKLKLKKDGFFVVVSDHAARKNPFHIAYFNANPNIQRQHSTPLKHYCALSLISSHKYISVCARQPTTTTTSM